MFWTDSQQQSSVVDTEAEPTDLPFTELSVFLTFYKLLSQKLKHQYFIKPQGTVWMANARSLENISRERELI